jgi:carbamoyl-phosphate synthase large subunit
MEQLGVEGELLATDVTEAAAALEVVDRKLIVPRTGTVDYIPAVEKIVRENDIGLIVPLTDLDLRSLARRRENFAELGCTVMIGDEPTIKLCRDKKLFSQFLAKSDFPTIRTFSLGRFRQDPFYPCFVKPMRGSAGHGSARIDSGRELRAHIHVFGGQLLVQDYVPGREYTIDVFRTRDGQIKSIVPRQRLIVRSGEVDQGVTVHDKELIEATINLVNSLDGLWGVFCCQCRRPEGEPPRFFEINPRFGGGSPLSIAAGANLPLYLLQEVLGLPVTGKVGEFTPNLLLMRYSNDFFKNISDPSELNGFDSPIFR